MYLNPNACQIYSRRYVSTLPLYARYQPHFFFQTFRNRLAEVIDQAQHFAGLGLAEGGGQSGDSALAFREGLEVTERERES